MNFINHIRTNVLILEVWYLACQLSEVLFIDLLNFQHSEYQKDLRIIQFQANFLSVSDYSFYFGGFIYDIGAIKSFITLRPH